MWIRARQETNLFPKIVVFLATWGQKNSTTPSQTYKPHFHIQQSHWNRVSVCLMKVCYNIHSRFSSGLVSTTSWEKYLAFYLLHVAFSSSFLLPAAAGREDDENAETEPNNKCAVRLKQWANRGYHAQWSCRVTANNPLTYYAKSFNSMLYEKYSEVEL